MFGFGVTELVLILIIIVVIFGAGKLPEIGAGFGKGIKNFKRVTSAERFKFSKIMVILDKGEFYADIQTSFYKFGY